MDEYILTKTVSAFAAGTVVYVERIDKEGYALCKTRSPVSINGSEEEYRTFWCPENLLAKKRDRHESDYIYRDKRVK